MSLSGEQIDRYSRQILVPEIGGRGQQRLLDSRIARVGVGPAISVAAEYLAAAGIGVGRCADWNLLDDLDHDLILADNRVIAPSTSTTPETPLVIFGETAAGSWYTRATTTLDCPACIEDAAASAGPDIDAPYATSSSAVAGAAAAVDVIAALVDLEPAPPAEVVLFGCGGATRHRNRLDRSHCNHNDETSELARR